MTEEPARELMLLLRERFPSAAQVREEFGRPVPSVWVEDRRSYRRGQSGFDALGVAVADGTRWTFLRHLA